MYRSYLLGVILPDRVLARHVLLPYFSRGVIGQRPAHKRSQELRQSDIDVGLLDVRQQ
jgi:hypothetical protein